MKYTRLDWRDGQPYSPLFDDVYCSVTQDERGVPVAGGIEEFRHVFYAGNDLDRRWDAQDDGFSIAELGFGSGLNFLLTVQAWLDKTRDNPSRPRLDYVAIEAYPLAPDDIRRVISLYTDQNTDQKIDLNKLLNELLDHYPPAIRGNHSRALFDGRVNICFCFMPASDALKGRRHAVDAWYLDGFTPANNASMWALELLAAVARNSKADASFATYTAAGQVRRDLQAAGFEVQRAKGFGKKREMLRGTLKDAVSCADETSYRYKDKPWLLPPQARSKPVTRATATATATQTQTVVILGAGVAGLSVADALCRRGVEVTVIDRNPDIAMQTSSNPAAIVYPRLAVADHGANAFYTDAFCYAGWFLERLQDATGHKPFWFRSGLLQAIKPDRLQKLIELDIYDSDNLSAITANGKSYASIPSAGFVLPPVLCQALRERCAQAMTYTLADIDHIDYQDGCWQLFSDSQPVAAAQTLVLATNQGVRCIQHDDLSYLDIDDVGGTSLAVKASPLSTERLDKVINDDAYITPCIAGAHHVGATYSTADRESEEGIAELLASFERYAGDGACSDHAQITDTWSGLRAIARDRLPVIGACPDAAYFASNYADIHRGDTRKAYRAPSYHDGLYLSLAHGSRGFTTSYLAAEIIASSICGQPVPVGADVLNAVSASRFLLRKYAE